MSPWHAIFTDASWKSSRSRASQKTGSNWTSLRSLTAPRLVKGRSQCTRRRVRVASNSRSEEARCWLSWMTVRSCLEGRGTIQVKLQLKSKRYWFVSILQINHSNSQPYNQHNGWKSITFRPILTKCKRFEWPSPIKRSWNWSKTGL